MILYLRNHIFTIVLSLIVASTVISIVAVSFRFNEADRLRKALARDAISQRLDRSFTAMNDFPGSAGKDILFLHNLSSVQSLHGEPTRIMSPEIRNDFKNFLENNGAYQDLFFYKKNFNCVMRVSSKQASNDLCEAPPPLIANVLAKAAPLSMGEVYISSLISYKDIYPDGEDIPIVAYVSPACPVRSASDNNFNSKNADNVFNGANTDCSIVSIVNANYFLEEMRRLARNDEPVFLLDGDGAYLANADRAKEKFSGGTGNFYTDFPDVPKGALDDTSVRWIETETKNFAFWRIYPTESNFAVYEGANKVLGKKHQDEYFWVMAAASDKPKASMWQRNLSYIAAIAAILITHLSVAGLVLTMSFKKSVLCSLSKP